MNPYDKFKAECMREISIQGEDMYLRQLSQQWMDAVNRQKYSYHFEWMGRPVIQYPQDLIATQEIIWNIKPDLIIETGIAHGGSLIFYASMLTLLDLSESVNAGTKPFNILQSKRKVIGIDIDIREHNRIEIAAHAMSSKIDMLEGSSIDENVINKVNNIARGYDKILILLDSNHTHEHVLAELEAYAPLTSCGSYCVVFDTVIDDMPEDMFLDRPWSQNNNPKTAVNEFLKSHPEFEIDKNIQNKLLITVAPDGYLRRKQV